MKIGYDDGKFGLEHAADLPEKGDVWLRLCVDRADGRFYYSLDGKVFLPAGAAFDASKLSDEYNRPLAFTGAYIGIGCQDLAGASKTADFAVFSVMRKKSDHFNGKAGCGQPAFMIYFFYWRS